ncbi:MAG TPA: sensor domain-containing protein, partial [Mycobacterium sp.]|nr:sensor domain-containing protein [Mycobacterium sp.]
MWHRDWQTVRIQTVHEPGDDFAHLAHQSVVSFSTPGDATALYTESVRAFQACANRRYTYDQPGQPAAVWNVREVASTGGVLAATLNQEGTDDWVCRRA